MKKTQEKNLIVLIASDTASDSLKSGLKNSFQEWFPDGFVFVEIPFKISEQGENSAYELLMKMRRPLTPPLVILIDDSFLELDNPTFMQNKNPNEGKTIVDKMRGRGSPLQNVPLVVLGLFPERKNRFKEIAGANSLILTSSDVGERGAEYIFQEIKNFAEKQFQPPSTGR